MHTSYWRMGLAAVLATGLLATGASAQEGASGDVNIKEKSPAVTQTGDTGISETKVVKPTIVDRDPFVNQITVSRIVSPDRPSAPVRPIQKISPGNNDKEPLGRPGADPIDDTVAVDVPEIPAPEVKVTGIVSSGSGSQAIISTSNGTRMVTSGQKLGDYRVSSIGPNYVSFSYGEAKVFKVPLASEF
ncbi:MAG: hypothetical protein KC800_29535 [Candidatus Eremiobacteraeota bacterium]|nr:hypothetical protein [Candidatus Eremiobacteraeota bacterium]